MTSEALQQPTGHCSSAFLSIPLATRRINVYTPLHTAQA